MADGQPPSVRRRVRGSVNRAVELLVDRPPADAVRALQAEYALSERQARRYVNAALDRPEGVAVPERTAVFTVRFAPSLIAGLREHARSRGLTLSATVTEAVRSYLDQAPSDTVARRVEIEFVSDRLAGARLAQAFGFVVPERRRVTHGDRSEDERQPLPGERADRPGGGDLRAGVLRAPAPGRDDPEPDRRAAELAADRGLLVPEDLVFEDEGFSGATLTRPALERLRDRAAEGAFEVLLCHAPDRLARATPIRCCCSKSSSGRRRGVLREGARAGATPEDELLRQFQGMIAEYERAQIPERTRRGKLHRARGGPQAVMSAAPYGYRYVKKSEHSEGFWEIDAAQAEIVREVFERYINDGTSIGEIARWLTERGVPTRTGKAVWDRSSVWGMLRNTAYRGQAAFGKTKTLERHGKPTRTTRARGERHGRRAAREDQPAEKWTLIPVPPLVSEETFELAQARLAHNAHFASATPRARPCCKASSSAASAATAAIAARPARRTNGSTTTGASALTAIRNSTKARRLPLWSGRPAGGTAPACHAGRSRDRACE